MYRQTLKLIADFCHDFMASEPENETENDESPGASKYGGGLLEKYRFDPETKTPLEWVNDRVDSALAMGYGPALGRLVDAMRDLQMQGSKLSGANGFVERLGAVLNEAIAAIEILKGSEPTTDRIAMFVSRDQAKVLCAVASAQRERAMQMLQKEMPVADSRKLSEMMGSLISDIRKATDG